MSAIAVKKQTGSLRRGMRLAARMRGVPVFPLFIVVVLVGIAVSADFITPHSPTEGELDTFMTPPFWMDGANASHPLGTDKLGRDILSRLIYGGRISLFLALLAVVAAGSVGTVVGLVAAYFGRWVDMVLMRVVDAALSLPLILIAIVLATVLKPSFSNVILVVALLLWPRYARQVRGEALAIKEHEYVAQARVAGCSDFRIIVRHIFPNVVPTLLVLATFQIGYVMLLESSLSFLGVGIPPPAPAWGLMVADGKGFVATSWWISFFPGAAIFLTVLGLNLLGDWVRDRLDPKLRQV